MHHHTATLTKVCSAAPMGEYRPTAIDAAKAAADILVTAINGRSWTVSSRVPLEGRGITAYSDVTYEVTDAALAELEKRYNVKADF